MKLVETGREIVWGNGMCLQWHVWGTRVSKGCLNGVPWGKEEMMDRKGKIEFSRGRGRRRGVLEYEVVQELPRHDEVVFFVSYWEPKKAYPKSGMVSVVDIGSKKPQEIKDEILLWARDARKE